MSAAEPIPTGVHFWWCATLLRPHTTACTCPPDRLRAALDREREAVLAEVAVRITTIVGEAK